MSYLLIKNGKSNRGPPSSYRNNGGRRNPHIGIRRPGANAGNGCGGGDAGGTSSWSRPSTSTTAGASSGAGPNNGNSNLNYRPSNAPTANSFSAANAGNAAGGFGGRSSASVKNGPHGSNNANSNATNGMAVNDGRGQVQLQRVAPSVQRTMTSVHQQPQVTATAPQQNQNLQQGLVSMDEVMNDIRILEQQQRDSHRMLESIKLTKTHKLEQKSSLETKLSKLKYQNGEMRAELTRANKELSVRHRELLEARTRCESSRKATNRFDGKLKRAIGVARVLGTYHNKIETAMIALNETETRLNFLKGQTLGKLNAAMVRRDDAKHRHELLVKAIYTNQQKERAITEDISKLRAEIAGNEHDLSSAQQMESQTKLRVETIEHEVEMERNRHNENMANLESKSKELDACKSKTLESIEEKKTMIDAKKAELRKVWNKCGDIRRAEGHDVPFEPKWGVDQIPSLDVARIRLRVNAKEEDLRMKKAEMDKLRNDVEDLEALICSNKSEIAEKREQAKTIVQQAEKDRANEALRKEKIQNAVEEANLEVLEVENLRQSIKELTVTQEKNSEDLKLRQNEQEKNMSSMEEEIESALAELAALEKRTAELKEHDAKRKEQTIKEAGDAKKLADIIKSAYERAQKEANDFASVPDDDLIVQMKQLDETEEEIINDANRERDAIIELEPLLDTINFDYNSETSLDEQAKSGLEMIRRHCLDVIKQAKYERLLRVEEAKEAHFAGIKAEAEARRLQEEEEERMRVEEDKRQEEAKIAAAELERKKQEVRRRMAEEAAAEKRRCELEAEKKRKREQELAKLREEEEAMKLEEERELKRLVEEEAAAAELKRKEEDKRRRSKEEEKRRARKETEEAERRAKKAADEEERRARKLEAEKKRKREQELAKLREEEEAMMLEEERELKMLAEEEEATAELKRKEEDKKRRAKEEEKRRARRAADEEKRRARKEAEEEKRSKEREFAENKRKQEELEEMRVRSEELKLKLDEEERQDERRRRKKNDEKKREDDAKAVAELKHKEEEKNKLRAAKEEEKRRVRKEKNRESIRSKPEKHQFDMAKDDGDDRWNADVDTGYDFDETLKEDITKRDDANKRRKKRELDAREKEEHQKVEVAEDPLDGSLRTISSSKKQRPSKSYNKLEALKLKSKSSRDDRAGDSSRVTLNKHKRSISPADGEAQGVSKRGTSHTQSVLSGPSQSAIKHKDSKRPKTSSSVRFDQSANRPKLDIFSSGVHNREEKRKSSKSSKSSSSKPSTQSSGISSCEVGGRRRKKASGKSKSKSLGLGGFEDDGAFL